MEPATTRGSVEPATTGRVYLDAASTVPLHPVARETLLAAVDVGWADPARLYGEGRRARMLLDGARESIAAALGARPDEVSFTGSGTQACHLGVEGALIARQRTGRHLVVSAVEHSSVLHAAESHERSGGTVGTVPVDRYGRVEATDVSAVLGAETALVCVQSANHEVGTLQPVEEIAELAGGRGIPLLVDAAQTLGRTNVPGGWSLLTASAHKWGGPAGVGVLAIRKGTRYRHPGPSGEREGGRVPGYENVPGALAAAASLEAVVGDMAAESARLFALVAHIRDRVAATVPDVEVVGDPVRRLPNLVTFSCLYVPGEALLTELDRAGFAVNSGSSCTSSSLTPSHVLEAMGVLSHGNVRVSLPAGTRAEDVDRFLDVLPGAVERLRRTAGVEGL